MTVEDSYQRHHTPASEIEHRIARLQERLHREKRESALIIQNVDLYYFTGCLQAGLLFVPAEGRPFSWSSAHWNAPGWNLRSRR